MQPGPRVTQKYAQRFSCPSTYHISDVNLNTGRETNSLSVAATGEHASRESEQNVIRMVEDAPGVKQSGDALWRLDLVRMGL